MIISILFTTYNRHDLLKKTIKYIDNLCDNYQKNIIEILISNANSKNKIKLKKTNNCKLRIFNHINDITEYENINFLITKSSGKYSFFLSDDDSIDDKFFTFFINLFKSKPHIDIAYFKSKRFTIDKLDILNNNIFDITYKITKPSCFLKSKISKEMIGFSAIYKTSILKKSTLPSFAKYSPIAIIYEQSFFIYTFFANKILYTNYSFLRVGLSTDSYSLNDYNITNYLYPSLRLIKYIRLNFNNIKWSKILIKNIVMKNSEILISRQFYNNKFRIKNIILIYKIFNHKNVFLFFVIISKSFIKFFIKKFIYSLNLFK